MQYIICLGSPSCITLPLVSLLEEIREADQGLQVFPVLWRSNFQHHTPQADYLI